MFVTARFELKPTYESIIRCMKPMFGYGLFGEVTYYRSYSRMMLKDGRFNKQEHWPDTVLRVINGVMSLRKDWYTKNYVEWKEDYWQGFAFNMAQSLFRMEWLPPGRGLWAMGTDLIYERGSMALYNCAFCRISENWITELCWFMETLMYGVGVGFKPERSNLRLMEPSSEEEYLIPDSREGWVEGLRRLLASFSPLHNEPLPAFNYSIIRPAGALIKTFGGIASGPEPLKAMYEKIKELLYRYLTYQYTGHGYDEIQFKTDLCNLIGVCVVTGNVRRSAEIAICEASDPIFMELKDYSKHPEREAWGWMSNNSVILNQDEDYENLASIAAANANGFDVGYINARNLPYGRIGKDDGLRYDNAIGCNPCGEIPLEAFETCNVVETLPTRCVDTERWVEACSYAAFYASTVSLLPTHSHLTNRVVARNRRIGVSIIDFTGWKEQIGVAGVTAALRQGYDSIREVNSRLADEAGVPASIRCTTVKPGGTVPKIAGRTAGAGHPTFKYTLRRIRIQQGTELERILIAAGVPHEPDVSSKMTEVFEFPIIQGPACPATEVSIWEQAMNLVLLQREWADNMVSNTLYFKPKWSKVKKCPPFGQLAPDEKWEQDRYGDNWLWKFNPNHEEDDLEAVLSAICPLTKSVSLLPHSDVGIFKQMPEEGISVAEYDRRINQLKNIDWSTYRGDGEDEKYCSSGACEVPK